MKISTQELFEAIQHAQSIVLTVHLNPDGDAMGSMLAMYEALIMQGKQVSMIVPDEVPKKYNFLPNVEKIQRVTAIEGELTPDMLLVLDASTYERIGEVGARCRAPIFNIDHHISNTEYADGLYLLPHFAATGEIVTHLCDTWNWTITPTMANALYMAISTDTGFYKFSNTTDHTLAMASLLVKSGAQPAFVSSNIERTSLHRMRAMQQVLASLSTHFDGKVAIIGLTQEMMELAENDTDGFVDLIRNIEGVDVAVVLKAKTDAVTRVSLRSHTQDVNAIANAFGGGGHIRAAGCTIEAPIAEAKQRLLKELETWMA